MNMEVGGSGELADQDNQVPELDWTEERLQARGRMLDAAVEKNLMTPERADYLRTHPSQAELEMEEAREVFAQGSEASVEWLLEGDEEYRRQKEKLKPHFDPEP